MTTIALDLNAREIATDSQATDGDGQKFDCQKLYRVNGHIIAAAGDSYAALLFIEWFDQWESEPDWEDRVDLTNLDLDEDFECIVIRPDGSCYTVNRLFVPLEQERDHLIAIGSGGKAAKAAMIAGATPTRAVEIASMIDTYTGGKVVTWRIPARPGLQP